MGLGLGSVLGFGSGLVELQKVCSTLVTEFEPGDETTWVPVSAYFTF